MGVESQTLGIASEWDAHRRRKGAAVKAPCSVPKDIKSKKS